MKLYVLNLNGAEAGPFTERQMRSMWQSGAITTLTPWRFEDKEDWHEGTELLKLLERPRLEPDAENASTPAQRRRDALRKKTAYPVLRGLLLGFPYFSAAASATAAGLELDWGTALCVGAAVLAVSLVACLVAAALVDGADAALRNVE